MIAARLRWLDGTSYPKPPRKLAIVLGGVPAADGSDGPFDLTAEDLPIALVAHGYGPPRW